MEEAKIKDVVEFFVIDSDDILYYLKHSEIDKSMENQLKDLQIPEYKIYKKVNSVSELIGAGKFDDIVYYKCKNEMKRTRITKKYTVKFENGDTETHTRNSFLNRFGIVLDVIEKIGEKDRTYSEFYITSITVEKGKK